MHNNDWRLWLTRAIAWAENTPDESARYDDADKADSKLVSAIGYVGILFLVPLFVKPQSRYARFHANQGMLLFVVMLVANIALWVLRGILNYIPLGGLIAWILSAAVNLALLAAILLGAWHALEGRAKELPGIGRYRILPMP